MNSREAAARGGSAEVVDRSALGPLVSGSSSEAMRGGEGWVNLGLLGLLDMVQPVDRDLASLGIGVDVAALGMHLTPDVRVSATFATPWADDPSTKQPQFRLPSCYQLQPASMSLEEAEALREETLFYIFYTMAGDVRQNLAAAALAKRGWSYHRTIKVWFNPSQDHMAPSGNRVFHYFDVKEWSVAKYETNQDLTAGFLPRSEVLAQAAERMPATSR